jgi:hypothetical protein
MNNWLSERIARPVRRGNHDDSVRPEAHHDLRARGNRPQTRTNDGYSTAPAKLKALDVRCPNLVNDAGRVPFSYNAVDATGHLRPIQLSPRPEPFDSDDYIFELKIDGFRNAPDVKTNPILST